MQKYKFAMKLHLFIIQYNMKFTKILTLLTLSTSLLLSCHSKKEIYIVKNSETDSISSKLEQEKNDPIIVLKNQIFSQNIKTVLCYKQEQQLSLPIINLESDEKLLISFDDLNTEKKTYLYTIIHCNSDWTKSNLMQSEYISGFYEETIVNYEFSFNTIQKYTHYNFVFPSKNMKPILSGNYIFKIYDENGNNVIHKKFMVLDRQTFIEANVRRATLAEYRKTKHEIDFTISHPNLRISDPFSEIKVHIKQNNKEDNAITNLTPQFVMNEKLDYNYEDINTFFGNNEFRHFDFSSLRYQSERIKQINFDSTYNHVYLFNDNKRTYDFYSIEPDINGEFLIKIQEGWKSNTEADYAFVHFNLISERISYGDLYLIGKFSDWELRQEFKLEYNSKQKKYEKEIYLKQGYYNYHYALNDTSTNSIDVSFIEGSHYQTRNDYYIYVYYRPIGNRYDRLVGFLKTSSKELF